MGKSYFHEKEANHRAAFTNPNMSPEDRMHTILQFYAEDGRFDANGVRDTKVLSVKTDPSTRFPTILYEITVESYLCSKMGTLHGGASCTLLDVLTSACLTFMASPGEIEFGHVSRTITMSYLRPVQQGQTVRVECRPVAVGKKTANLYGEIRSLEGKVCVTCIHDKALFPSTAAKL